MKVWMKDPHSGGVKIPKNVQELIRKRIEEYASKNYAGRYKRLDIRFKGAFCYIDAYQEPDEPFESLLKITGETRGVYARDYVSFARHYASANSLKYYR